MTDWQVRIQEDWPMRGYKVLVSRLSMDRIDVLGPDGVIEGYDEGTMPPDEKLWHLPVGALESMRDEIDRLLGRRHDEQLVDELRNTLGLERMRVDKVLDAHLALSRPILTFGDHQ